MWYSDNQAGFVLQMHEHAHTHTRTSSGWNNADSRPAVEIVLHTRHYVTEYPIFMVVVENEDIYPLRTTLPTYYLHATHLRVMSDETNVPLQ